MVTVKTKFYLEKFMKAHGEYRCRSTLSLIPALNGGDWPTPRPGRFNPRKEILYLLYRRLGGLHGRSGWVWNISPHRDLIPGP